MFDDEFVVQMVTASSEIENIGVTEEITRRLLANGSLAGATGSVYDLRSVHNNKRVAQLLNAALYARQQMSVELILDTHARLMFGAYDSERWAKGERPGRFKVHDYVIGRDELSVPPEYIEESIEELCDMVNSATADGTKCATVFHCVFETMHPFADGNGRCGRWLLNYILALHDCKLVIIQPCDRQLYYEALDAYATNEDLSPMYELLQVLQKRS